MSCLPLCVCWVVVASYCSSVSLQCLKYDIDIGTYDFYVALHCWIVSVTYWLSFRLVFELLVICLGQCYQCLARKATEPSNWFHGILKDFTIPSQMPLSDITVSQVQSRALRVYTWHVHYLNIYCSCVCQYMRMISMVFCLTQDHVKHFVYCTTRSLGRIAGIAVYVWFYGFLCENLKDTPRSQVYQYCKKSMAQ